MRAPLVSSHQLEKLLKAALDSVRLHEKSGPIEDYGLATLEWGPSRPP